MSPSKTPKPSKTAAPSYAYDVTINVTAHAEGYLLYKTLRAIEAQIDYAIILLPGIKIEINIGLDKSDQLTANVLENYSFKNKLAINVYKLSYGEPGSSRNYLIDKSGGEYILNHDGDDLMTSNFLGSALTLARKKGVPAVYSPQFLAPFNHQGPSHFLRMMSSTNPQFSIIGMFSHNSYHSQNLVHSEIYRKIKYKPSTKPYGYEDWHWNTEVLAAGYDFVAVKNTIIFYRRKLGGKSLLDTHVASNCVLMQSALYSPEHFASLRLGSSRTPEEDDSSYTDKVAGLPLDITNKDSRPIIRRLPSKVIVYVFGRNRLYYFLKNQYHSIQQLFAPITHVVRALNTLPNFLYYQRLSIESFLPISLARPKKNTPLSVQETAHFRKLVHKTNLARLNKAGVSNGHINLWKQLNQIEPHILFDENSLSRLTISNMNRNNRLIDQYYYNLCVRLQGNVTDILLVPFIVRGGADLAMIHLVSSIASQQGRNVLVLTTNGMESAWKSKMLQIKGVTMLESHIDLPGVPAEEIELLLLRIVQNWGIQTLTIMNSQLGYQLVSKHGEALASNTKIFFHFYGLARNKQGMLIEWFPLPDVFEYSTKIITDCNRHEDEIREINGWEKQKTQTIYLPMNTNIKEQAPKRLMKKMLFAGRISHEKIIDVLLEVAELLQKDNVHLDIYGTKDEAYADKISFDDTVAKLKNVTFMGPFEGYESLNLSKYDLLIYTSIYEGIPLVVLDTIKANLFVISANVGGIAEVISDGNNGLLVSDNTNPIDYAEKVRTYYNSTKLQDTINRRAFNKDIIRAHSVENYKQSVLDAYLG